MSYYPKIPYYRIKPRTERQQLVYDLLDPKISMERMYDTLRSHQPSPAQSTVDAYNYLKKHHPERLPAWLERHPGFVYEDKNGR